MLVLLIGGCIAYRFHVATRTLPIGRGPAGPLVPEESFSKTWSEKKIVLIGIGDSITRGFGAKREHAYFSLLLNNDNKQYPDMTGRDLAHVLPKIEAHNYTVNYSTTKNHLSGLLQIPTWPGDTKGIVVVTSGGNDLIHDYGRSPARDGALYGCTYDQAVVWTEKIEYRLRSLVEGLTEKFPGGCEIFLANIYDPTDGVGDQHVVGFPRWRAALKTLNLTNQKIAELCDSYANVHLVDIHSAFLGHGIHCTEFWRKHYDKEDPHYWYYHNFEDPNPRGYDAIRRLFLLDIMRVLPERLKQQGVLRRDDSTELEWQNKVSGNGMQRMVEGVFCEDASYMNCIYNNDCWVGGWFL